MLDAVAVDILAECCKLEDTTIHTAANKLIHALLLNRCFDGSQPYSNFASFKHRLKLEESDLPTIDPQTLQQAYSNDDCTETGDTDEHVHSHIDCLIACIDKLWQNSWQDPSTANRVNLYLGVLLEDSRFKVHRQALVSLYNIALKVTLKIDKSSSNSNS